MKIKNNQELLSLNTLKIKSIARYFVIVKTIDDLKKAVDFAKQNQLLIFILGGGSNILVPDKGVNGLVVKMEIKGIEFCENDFSKSKKNLIIAGAGENWDNLVKQTIKKNLYGLENLSYIPGTVGASVVQNIGAYGVEVKDIVCWVEIFDIKTGEIKKIKNSDCYFDYRSSLFKKSTGKNFIVVRVAYNLQRDGKLKTNYKDIQDWITSSALKNFSEPNFSITQRVEPLKNLARKNCKNPQNPKQLREIIIKIRKNKLSDWKKIGTAGSFFKNPIVKQKQLNKLLKKYPEIPYYKSGISDTPQFKIPLAYILDKILDLKGFEEGSIGLYKNQPLVLVNLGSSTSAEIKNFAQKIQKQVKQKTGLDIDFEVVEW